MRASMIATIWLGWLTACGDVVRRDDDLADSGGNTSGPLAACGGVACAEGEECCFGTGLCVAPGTEACPRPSDGPPGSTPCNANSHCAADELCQADLCLGPGACVSRTNCGSCNGAPGDCSVCACDGTTHDSIQASCLAGVRVHYLLSGGCGAVDVESQAGPTTWTTCGVASPCPDGDTCCPITGQCYTAPEEDWLCSFPPEGTEKACLDDWDCAAGSHCRADACGAPGGCSQMDSCGPQLEPVCGCDGIEYQNAECASSAGVNVDHSGVCE